MHGTGLLEPHPWVPRRALSVAQYHRMGEAGILSGNDMVELIEGEIMVISKLPAPAWTTTTR